MRWIIALERPIGQVLVTPSSSQICRSCRVQTALPQRRFIQASARQRADSGITGRLKSAVFGGSDKANQPSAGVSADASGAAQGQELQPSTQPKSDLPAGWVKSPDQDPNYIEATTWEGLERIGSNVWVEDQYDPYDSYEGWAPMSKSRKLEKDEAEKVLRSVVHQVVAPEGTELAAGPLATSEWLSYSLSDPVIKFRISKLMQRQTGIKIPDFAMNSAANLHDLRSILLVKPVPKKLVQDLKQNEQFQELANVKVHSRRITPIDKDKAVGRWKVIEQELTNRGLPVTRHSGRVKNVHQEDA